MCYEVRYRTKNGCSIFWAKTKNLAFADAYTEECLRVVEHAASVYIEKTTTRIIKEVNRNE